MKKEEKGITLVALVVTIIVLLILTGVSIVTITGEDGIIQRTLAARWEQERAQYQDFIDLAQAKVHMADWKGDKTAKELLEGIQEILDAEEYFDGAHFEIKDENIAEPTLIIQTKQGHQFKVTEEEVEYIGSKEDIGDITAVKTGDIQITAHPTTWTSGNVGVKIEVKNENYTNHPELYQLEYSKDMKEWEKYDGEFEVDKNTIIYARLINTKIGYQIDGQLAITNIDKTAPEIKSLSKSDVNWENTEGKVTVTAKVKDQDSGIVKYMFTTNGNPSGTMQMPESFWTKITATTEELTLTYDVTKETFMRGTGGEIYLYIYDAVGNLNYQNIHVSITEGTRPTISLTASTNNWTNQNVELTGKSQDTESGIVAYGWTENATEPSGTTTTGELGKWTNITATTQEITQKTILTANGTRYFWTKDGAGNVNTATQTISKIDKTAPSEFTLTSKSSIGGVNAFDLTANFKDANSGLSRIIWYIYVQGQYTGVWKSYTDTYVDINGSTAGDKDATKTRNSTAINGGAFATGGEYKVYAEAWDVAGNKVTSYSSSNPLIAATSQSPVMFNANAGSDEVTGMPQTQFKYRGVNITLPTNIPIRTGYTFLGWSNSSTATAASWQAGGNYNEDSYSTLYAVWKANTYTVTYNGNGATSRNTESSSHTYDIEKALTTNGFIRYYTVTYNHNYSGSTNTTRTANYKFTGWNTVANGSGTAYADGASVKNLATSGNINLYAQWASDAVLYTPTRTGYTFGGWYSDSACTNFVTNGKYIPTAEITLYAKWTANTYTVTYNGNGATSGSTASSTHTYDVAKALTANGFKRSYTVKYSDNGTILKTDTVTYDFRGWDKVAGGTPGPNAEYSDKASVTNLATSGSVTLYAHWLNQSLDVSRYVPTKTGYVFEGWYKEAACTNKVTVLVPTSNTTLYAKWTPKTYTVTIDPNGGQMGGYETGGSYATSSQNRTFSYKTSYKFATAYYYSNSENGYLMTRHAAYDGINPVTFYREGYTFDGWVIKSGGGSVKTNTITSSGGVPYYSWSFDGNYAGNVTIQAQWEEKDTTKPTISLTPNTTATANSVTLTGTSQDTGSGIVAYSWTTTATTPTSWTNITQTTAQVTQTTTLSANGTWYFWTKDGAGNINNAAITVSNIVPKVNIIAYNNLTLVAGNSGTPGINATGQAKSVTYASSNTNIATINATNGLVTAKAAGTAYMTVTFTNYDNTTVSATCTVTVQAAVAQVGTTYYASITSAVDSAPTNGTVTVVSDVDESVQIKNGRAVVLNLNQKTIVGRLDVLAGGGLTLQGSGGTLWNTTNCTIAIAGTFTMNDSNVTIDNADNTDGSCCMYVKPGGVARLYSGNVYYEGTNSKNSAIYIEAGGRLEYNGGKVVNYSGDAKHGNNYALGGYAINCSGDIQFWNKFDITVWNYSNQRATLVINSTGTLKCVNYADGGTPGTVEIWNRGGGRTYNQTTGQITNLSNLK